MSTVLLRLAAVGQPYVTTIGGAQAVRSAQSARLLGALGRGAACRCFSFALRSSRLEASCTWLLRRMLHTACCACTCARDPSPCGARRGRGRFFVWSAALRQTAIGQMACEVFWLRLRPSQASTCAAHTYMFVVPSYIPTRKHWESTGISIRGFTNGTQ
jgi:hypothetical protein